MRSILLHTVPYGWLLQRSNVHYSFKWIIHCKGAIPALLPHAQDIGSRQPTVINPVLSVHPVQSSPAKHTVSSEKLQLSVTNNLTRAPREGACAGTEHVRADSRHYARATEVAPSRLLEVFLEVSIVDCRGGVPFVTPLQNPCTLHPSLGTRPGNRFDHRSCLRPLFHHAPGGRGAYRRGRVGVPGT